MRKLISMGFMLFLVLSLFVTGCVPTKNQPETSKGSDPNITDTNSPIEVSIFTPKFASDGDFNENELTQIVEEKFNIKIKWEYANQDAAKEKRQLSLASGDYPDAFWLVTWIDDISKVEAQKYGQEGIFLPLNDLIKEHAPNLQKAMGDMPYLKNGITAPDGNIYGLPLNGECYHCSRYGKLWINTEWLKTLKLEMPTTTEEFKQVLTAFKNEDPNGNGKKDEIPLSGESRELGNNPTMFLMNAFIPNNGLDYINVNDGKLSLAPMQQEWKEGLSYIHSLYKEGLIDQGSFTQNGEALKQLGTPEGEPILGAAAASHSAIFVDLNSEHSKKYDVVPPIKGPNGAQFTPSVYGNVNNFAFAITDKAKGEKAEALIKLADFFYSEEGALAATYGKEGVHWRKGEPGDIDLNGKPAKYAKIPSDPNKKEEDIIHYGWGERGPLLQTRAFRDSMATSTDEWSAEGYERRLYNATLKYDGFEPTEQFNAAAAWVDPKDAEEVALLKINMNKYIEENIVQFVTGSKNVEKDWDHYLSGFQQLQIDRYLEIYQKAYDAGK